MAIFLVAALRLFLPITILRWPFWGLLLAIAADTTDIIIVEALGSEFGTAQRYQIFDKFFDLYYLALAFWVTRQWSEPLARRWAAALFLWRMSGLAVFEATHIRQLIFFAPNIFENFYILVAGLKQFFPTVQVGRKKRLIVLLLIAAVPKIAQEYLMHYLEFPTWSFIKHNIFRWP